MHMIVGNVLEPLLFGHSLDLQPVVILLSLMVWGMLWGLVGMVLAVPITAVIKIHLSTIDHPLAASLVHVLGGGGGSSSNETHKIEPIDQEQPEDTSPLEGSREQGCRGSRGIGACAPLILSRQGVDSGYPSSDPGGCIEAIDSTV